MTRYDSFLGGYSRPRSHNPVKGYFDSINNLYDQAHGGFRYLLSQLPVSGKLRQFADTYQKWEDAYNNTGRDPNYSTAYGSGGIPFVNDAFNALAKPARMARTLAKMYGVEVELDLVKEKKELEQMRAVNGYNYRVGSHALADHWMEYQRMKK